MHKRRYFMKRYSYCTLTKNRTTKIRLFFICSNLLFGAEKALKHLSETKYYINHVAKTYAPMRQLTALSFWQF